MKKLLTLITAAIMMFAFATTALATEIISVPVDNVVEEGANVEYIEYVDVEEAIDGVTLSEKEIVELPTISTATQSVSNGVMMMTAAVNNLEVDTVQAAINEAGTTETTITLTEDTTEDITIAEGQVIILDLAGFTLTNVSSHTITNNGTLTIKDSVGTGIVDNLIHQKAAVNNAEGAMLTINGGKYTRTLEGSGNSYYVINNGGTFVLNDGDIIGTAASSSTVCNGASNYPVGQDPEPKMTMNGGYISSTDATALINRGTLTITDGELKAIDGYALQTWNNVTMSGGKITGTASVFGWDAGTAIVKGSLELSGSAIIDGLVAIYDYEGNMKGLDDCATLVMKDNADVSGYVYCQSYQDGGANPQANVILDNVTEAPLVLNNTHGDITIKGNTTVDTTYVVADIYRLYTWGDINVEEDAVLTLKSLGMTSNGENLGTIQVYDKTGLDAALAMGGEIKLMADIETASTISITKSLTLDLGGYTIDTTSYVGVGAGTGTVTIQNGEITRSSGNVISASSAEALILKDLKVTATDGYAIQMYNGENQTYPLHVYIEDGCELSGVNYGIAIFGNGSSSPTADFVANTDMHFSITVNGGKIICDNGAAIGGSGSWDCTKITINGGELISKTLGIYHPQVGDLTINGGTITGLSGIQFCCDGTFTMTGGTIHATADVVDWPSKDASEGDGYAEAGAALVFISRGVKGTGYQNLEQGMYATISGGKLISDNNAAIQVVRMDNMSSIYGDNLYYFNDTIESKQAEQGTSREIQNWLKELTITGGVFDGATDFSVETKAYEEGVITISGGEYSVTPDTAWIVTGYEATTEADINGYYTIVNVVEETVTEAVKDLTEDSTATEVATAAGTVAAIPNEDLLDHLDTVETVDALLVAAVNNDTTTGTIAVSTSIDTTSVDITKDESIADEDLKVSTSANTTVSGLALAVVGNDLPEADTTVTVTLEIEQTKAEAKIDDDGNTSASITYDIKPYVDYSNDSEGATLVANDEISAPITFTLHLPSIFDDTNRATLTHDGEDKGTYVVYHDGYDSYITVTTTHFSEFVVTLADSVSTSSSSVKKYSNDLEVGDGGSAYATPLSASSGTTVYINVSPNTGYEVDEVLVDGGDITVTDCEDGSYSYKQPAYAVAIEVTFQADGTVDEEEVEEEVTEEETTEALTDFADVVVGAWYEEYVAAAVEAGIMQGNSDTEFAPNGTTTRAMMIQVLFNMSDEPETENDEAAWYSEALAWGMEFGITDGSEITGDLTREQLVTMLYRYAMSNGVDTSATGDLTTYGDYETVADWATDAFTWAVGEGIINGDTDGNLNPLGNATRAELAKIMVSYLGE